MRIRIVASSARHPAFPRGYVPSRTASIALFNDAALGIAPEPGAILEYAAGSASTPRPSPPGPFPRRATTSGAAATLPCSWSRRADRPDYLPAHGHGDIFSFELSLDGRRVVVDGGTSSYEAGHERDWARSTRAHNTVEIAGADQCEFFGAFRVGRRGRPRDVWLAFRTTGSSCLVARRLPPARGQPGPPSGAAAVRARGPLAVWDMVEARVPHAAVSRIRFAPGARCGSPATDAATIEVARRRDSRCGLSEARCRSRRATTPRASASAWPARFWRSTSERAARVRLRARASAASGASNRCRWRWLGGRTTRAARAGTARGRSGRREDRTPQPLLLAGARARPSARLLEMSREWVAQGHEVTVVTNFPNHPTGVVPEAYRGRSFQVEHVHGLRVVRCRTYATPNRGFAEAHARPSGLHVRRPCAGHAALAGQRRAGRVVADALLGRRCARDRRRMGRHSYSRCATCGRRSSSSWA